MRMRNLMVSFLFVKIVSTHKNTATLIFTFPTKLKGYNKKQCFYVFKFLIF